MLLLLLLKKEGWPYVYIVGKYCAGRRSVVGVVELSCFH